jgi:hypothetical protein
MRGFDTSTVRDARRPDRLPYPFARPATGPSVDAVLSTQASARDRSRTDPRVVRLRVYENYPRHALRATRFSVPPCGGIGQRSHSSARTQSVS